MSVSGSASPKFKVIVHGVAEGCHPQRVRAALASRFGITPAQVEQLLASQGGLLTELVDHQTAWQLKSLLEQLGVECRIAPVPLAGLHDASDRLSLHAPATHRHVGHAPMRRQPGPPLRQSVPAPKTAGTRSSPARTVSSRSNPRPAGAAHPQLWRMLAVVAVAFVLGWYLQSARHQNAPAAASASTMADILR